MGLEGQPLDQLVLPPTTHDPASPVASTVWANGLGWYSRVMRGGPLLCTKLGIFIAVSSGNLSVAAYVNSGVGVNAAPAARKGTSGAVTSPGTGYREIALLAPTLILPGDWLAVSGDNGTLSLGLIPTAFFTTGANHTKWRSAFNFTAQHPLPNPAPALTGHGAGPFVIGIA